MANQDRQPAGIPTGGQFAPADAGRATVVLDSVAPDLAAVRAEEAYADYTVAVDHQNVLAVKAAATAVRAAYPNARHLVIGNNPDYRHDGHRYTIDKIVLENGTIVDGSNWPDGNPSDPDGSKWRHLAPAQAAIERLIDNDIDTDNAGALAETHGIEWDDELDYGDKCFIDVAEHGYQAPSMIAGCKADLAAGVRHTAASVDAMNETAFAAIDALAARDYPSATKLVISRDSSSYYEPVHVEFADGRYRDDYEIASRFAPLVQNLHEGHDSYLIQGSFLRRVDGTAGEATIILGSTP